MSEKHLCICNNCKFEQELEVVGRYGDVFKEPSGWFRQNIKGVVIDLCVKCESKLIRKKKTVRNFDRRTEQVIKMLNLKT